jgi:hypothetical protein
MHSVAIGVRMGTATRPLILSRASTGPRTRSTKLPPCGDSVLSTPPMWCPLDTNPTEATARVK